ncbi:MAG: hypothetical protein AAF738_01825 [Bacteroidota bacterium]
MKHWDTYKRGYIYGGLFLVIIVAQIACEPPKARISIRALVEQKLAQKTTDWETEKKQRCRREALDAAARRVDSMLIEQARMENYAQDRPLRPMKPDYPDVFILQDTTSSVRPLFPDSLR